MRRLFRKYWYVILVVIIILGSAVTIYILKTPPDLGADANLADRIFDFLDQWASAGGPALTLLLAIAAFLAIWQTRSMQKSEKRERLLNEIIEWAENALAIITKYPTVHFEQLEDLLIRANVIKAERYTIVIKASIFDQNLKTLVSNAIKELEDFIERADKHVPGMGRKQRIPVPTNLEPTLVKLIEKAAKLRDVL